MCLEYFSSIMTTFLEMRQTEKLEIFHSGNNLRKHSLEREGNITGPMSPTVTIIATYCNA